MFFSSLEVIQMWFVMDIIDRPSRLHFISNYIDLMVQSLLVLTFNDYK